VFGLPSLPNLPQCLCWTFQQLIAQRLPLYDYDPVFDDQERGLRERNRAVQLLHQDLTVPFQHLNSFLVEAEGNNVAGLLFAFKGHMCLQKYKL